MSLQPEVSTYTLSNAQGMRLTAIPYGATVTALYVPDRAGRLTNVVLGYPTLAAYHQDTFYMGCAIGRYANRIAGARFHLDGRSLHLTPNDGPHCLHGGPQGWHRALWQVEPQITPAGMALVMRHTSPDGQGGFPGTVTVEMTYTLTDDNVFQIDYHAVTDQPTVINLTHHSYFNLAGAGDIRDHHIQIDAQAFTPVGADLIPTGEVQEVKGAFDFRAPARLGTRLSLEDEQLRRGRGYDHNWVLHPAGAVGLKRAARLTEPTYGRCLEVWTDQPGLQLYTGNWLHGPYHRRHAGLCLEAQAFPDAPNRPAFPATVLRPGESYRQCTRYCFSVDQSTLHSAM